MHLHKFRFLIVLSIAALTSSVVAPACATTITTYTSLASWTAASTGVQLLDFENSCLSNCLGVSFTGLSGTIGIQDTTGISWMDFGTHKAAYINTNSAATPTIRILLPGSVTAFGLYLFSANPNALTFTITTLSNTFNVATNPTPTPRSLVMRNTSTADGYFTRTLGGSRSNQHSRRHKLSWLGGLTTYREPTATPKDSRGQ